MTLPELAYLVGATATAAYSYRLNYVALGEIMLAEAGAEACAAGYGTTDPEWVGRYAIEYGDITPEGELN
jgi:hypothetical protein